MNIYLDCIPCFLRQSLDAARIATDDTHVHEEILRDVLKLAARIDMASTPPAMAQQIHRRLKELTGVTDPYQEAKQQSNQLMSALLPQLRRDINNSPSPFLSAVKLSIAGNIIDFGARSNLSEDDVISAIRHAIEEPISGQWSQFKQQLETADDILFLADNAGELVLDRLLIEMIGPERITLVVRGEPVINDVTMADAKTLGLTDIVNVIGNGSDAPGTILSDCSESFKKKFQGADIIISKGQGNYESLSGTGDNIYFLFQVKCPVIANHTGLPLGTRVLQRGEYNKKNGQRCRFTEAQLEAPRISHNGGPRRKVLR